MRVFAITPGQFGLAVSAYAISAGVSGVAVGFLLDRYDRKRALLGLYPGCALVTICLARFLKTPDGEDAVGPPLVAEA